VRGLERARERETRALGFATIPVTRPGLAKARAPVVAMRPTLLVRATEARWREMFDRADVVSEGCARVEANRASKGMGRMWYGSTSLILPADAAAAPFFAAVAQRDVHVRVRALRAAYREAASRAPGRLGRISCEVRIIADPRGVRIDVDVQAPLIEKRAVSRPAP
jgi:hypothetical protein